MTRPSDTAYIYASTKVKSADGNGTESSRLKALLDCTTVRDVYDAVVDSAICPTAEKRAVSGDSDAVLAASEVLAGALDYAADLVREAVPEPELYSFLFYKYDCNNIKAAIKSHLCGVSADGTMFICANISPELAAECVKSRNTASLPYHMAKATLEAIDTFERTGEARSIDFILDRASFADMAADAAKSGVTMFSEYVSALADTTNIRSAVRISDSSIAPAAAEALMARVFVPGGSVAEDVFRSENGGVAALEEIYGNFPLIPLKAELAASLENKALTDAILDRFVQHSAGELAATAFGPEAPAQFFIAREREIRRYRKALSILSMGSVKKETIKERLGIL